MRTKTLMNNFSQVELFDNLELPEPLITMIYNDICDTYYTFNPDKSLILTQNSCLAYKTMLQNIMSQFDNPLSQKSTSESTNDATVDSTIHSGAVVNTASGSDSTINTSNIFSSTDTNSANESNSSNINDSNSRSDNASAPKSSSQATESVDTPVFDYKNINAIAYSGASSEGVNTSDTNVSDASNVSGFVDNSGNTTTLFGKVDTNEDTRSVDVNNGERHTLGTSFVESLVIDRYSEMYERVYNLIVAIVSKGWLSARSI